ncbi:MAG: 3,4-dihydroxy-2-butanone-4-phosphate synthase [Candidatus Hadarchaeota archaeon]
MSVEKAVQAMKKGLPLLVHDSAHRENEVDMVMRADAVKPSHVALMRRDGGGLVCVALHPKIAKNFNLPYMQEIYRAASSNFSILSMAKADDIPYDERSAFSISVNHRRTFTGITDVDRALTISELGKLGAKALNGSAADEFGKEFRSPGHVHLLISTEEILKERKGHTELVVALAELAEVTPVVAICEMLDEKTGKALSKDDAAKYARELGLELLDGADIARAYLGRGA